MDHLHKVLQDNHYPPQFFQQGKPQQKANRSLKEDFQTTEIKPHMSSEITTSPQNTKKQNLKILQ